MENNMQELYTDGKQYALLVTSKGVMPPGSLSGLVYVGPPQGVVTRLTYRYKQSEIAEMLGVEQQTVSRWVEKYSNMQLSEAAWHKLASLVGESQSITVPERSRYDRPKRKLTHPNQPVQEEGSND